jgi:hypothetical protein
MIFNNMNIVKWNGNGDGPEDEELEAIHEALAQLPQEDLVTFREDFLRLAQFASAMGMNREVFLNQATDIWAYTKLLEDIAKQPTNEEPDT